MAGDNRKEFSLEDILEEQRMQKNSASKNHPANRGTNPQSAQPMQARPAKADAQQQRQQPAKAAVPREQDMGRNANKSVSTDTEDIGMFATGAHEVAEAGAPEQAPVYADGHEDVANYDDPMAKPKKQKKKKRGGFFGRKKKAPEYDEAEDMYYGVQLKPIDEYRKGFDETGEISLEESTYVDLFDDSKKAIDEEVEKNFKRLQKERRARVAEAVKNAGLDESEIEDELGIIAPMPVSSYAADPYTKQHGIEVEGPGSKEADMPGFQKAMLDNAAKSGNTMEIKLNVLNDTVEIQKVHDNSPVAEDTVNRILEVAPPAPIEPEPEIVEVYQEIKQQEAVKQEPQPRVERQQEKEPEQAEVEQKQYQTAPREEVYPEEIPEERPIRAVARQAEESVEPPAAQKREEQPAKPAAAAEDTLIEGRNEPVVIPQVSSIYEYRSRGISTHVIDADVLQSALLSEIAGLKQAGGKEEKKREQARKPKRPAELEQQTRQIEQFDEIEPEDIPAGSTREIYEEPESIDDYTGEEDARSISNELKGDMRDLTLRMLITGACTIVLTFINLIFSNMFSSGADAGASPAIYIVLTLIFLGASIGVCYKTIINGLKALLTFNANSDSAVSVAALGVILQTVAGLFFMDDIVGDKLHLYAVVLTAILFVNIAGKLTMIRRIHSNFRFVTSREQKYSVKLYDDYNTALKMTKDVVADKPVVAYQTKTGFLKRFLELSYMPDPAEVSSQMLAPISLIASLVLCIVCMLITGSVAAAITALAAALCASVAVTNMLAMNLPVSRLCKTARRAGAMVVGYEAVKEAGNVNAVMIDAEELFPRGTVVLNGIKTYGGRANAEDAIMAASALMNEVGGPLSGVFDQVISENEDALPEVESYEYEDGNGICGRVDGRRILIGNRSLIINHHLEAPNRDDENQYATGSKQVIYIAVDESIAAMMVLTYTADRRRKNELQRLEDHGVSIVVRTTDVNVTAQFVSRLFGIDNASVTVLSNDLGEIYADLVKDEIPRSDATIATKGRVESLMSVISACVSNKRSANFVIALQNTAVVLGFVLVAFLSCFNALKQLSSFTLFIFELFWLLVIIVLPKLRKP